MVPTVTLHPAGPAVSRIVLGTWKMAALGLDDAGLRELIAQAAALGVTTVDHADIYGGYTVERRFGDALAGAAELRRRLQFVSKCGIALVDPARPAHRVKHYDASAAHLHAAVDGSLRALRIDRLDLLLLHRPDLLMEADETAAALHALVQAGKVGHVGVSNFPPEAFELLAARLELPLVTHQIELSPLHLAPFTDGTLDRLQRRRVRPMAWSPLAGGRLFGDEPRAQRVLAALHAVGEELGGRAADQIAYAWLLRHPAGIVPVVGTHRVERLRAAADAIAVAGTMSRQQWYRIWSASTGQELP